MKKFLSLTVGLFFLLSFLTSCENKKADEQEKTKIIIGIVINKGTASSANFSCTNSAPLFATLAESGTTARCAGCHGVGSTNGGVDVTNYSNLKGKVSAKNPEGSLLYNVVAAGGKMSQYTDSKLTEAIYCWIKGGANP